MMKTMSPFLVVGENTFGCFTDSLVIFGTMADVAAIRLPNCTSLAAFYPNLEPHN